jgi:hypothetical protein
MVVAVIIKKFDWWLWAGYSIIILEAITLLIFNCSCPLTLVAHKYSNSQKDNFDIYLPNWLAKYNKVIYTVIAGFVLVITIYQLLAKKS